MTEAEKQREYVDADWLRDTEWYWSPWKQSSPEWTHDHCFFCHACICGYSEHLHECWYYRYLPEIGSYETVCATCFDELRETFRWKAIEAPVSGPQKDIAAN